MAMDQEQARVEIVALFKTAWDAGGDSTGIEVLYQSDGRQPPDAEETGEDGLSVPWARFSIRHGSGETRTVGNAAGQQKETQEGILTCEIRVSLTQGLRQADKIAKIVKNAFRGQRTAGGATFKNVTSQERGRDGVWFRMDVLADFEYDEIV